MDKNINIACGDCYLENWLNFDYTPHSKYVKKANLTDRIPIFDQQANVVYSSHFIEHLPISCIPKFISECFRVIAPRGIIRLVLPDFEELCRTYIKNREVQDHQKADFLMLEIIDQYARLKPGGKLDDYYEKIYNSKNNEMIDYVKKRTGHVISNKEHIIFYDKLKKIIYNPSRIMNALEYFYIRALIKLLPPSFREQNVSLTNIGEKHLWAYDFYIIQKLLLDSGFCNIQRMSANTSNIQNFPFFPLDIHEDGSPRKGLESMYIEATKP